MAVTILSSYYFEETVVLKMKIDFFLELIKICSHGQGNSTINFQ